MVDEQKPDPWLLGLGFRREVASAKNESGKISRTPSFGDWMDKRAISHTCRPPTPSPRPQIQPGRILVKNEPWSSSSEAAYLQSLSSASKDWIPNKPPKNKLQSHYSSNEEPAVVPFSPPNQRLNAVESRNQVKLLPMPFSIPTKPRSGLKRKARGSEQSEPHQTPSPSTINTSKKSVDNLLCEICQIGCSSAITMQQHLKGRQHKAKLMYRQLKRGCNGGRKGRPRCDVCQIWCSDRDGLEMHYKGQKHKAKLQELELCKNNGREKVSKTPILCELCHVPCMNEDLYKMHLKGKQHAIREELKRRGMV